MNAKVYIGFTTSLLLGVGIGWFSKTTTEISTTEPISTKSNRLSTPDNTTGYPTTHREASKRPETILAETSASATQTVTEIGNAFRQTLDPIESSRLFDQLLAKLTPENALEIRELVKNLSPRSSEFQKFYYAWGRIAGAKAANFGLTSTERDGGALIQGWASANPDDALEWLNNIESEEAFNSNDNIRNLSRYKNILHDRFVQGLFVNDPIKAASYLSSLPTAQANTAAENASDIVEKIISKNGVDAAREWAALLSDSNISKGAISEIADEWSEQNPVAALEWVMSQSDESTRQSSLYQVWRNMAQGSGNVDPFSAAEEINTMPESSDKDYALSGYAAGARRLYPETAIEAALGISDPELREETIITSASYYLRREPEAANTWLETSGLSDDLVQSIIKNSRRGRR